MPLRGHLTMSGDLIVITRGRGACYWSLVKTGSAAKSPTMNGTAPASKKYPAPDVDHGQVEKPFTCSNSFHICNNSSG